MKILCEITKADSGIIIANYNGFIPEIDKTKIYDVEIKEHKSKRSLESNRMFWGIIQQIKDATDNDLMDIYAEVLERCDVKHEYLLVLPETIEALKKVFRAVKILEYRDYNGKEMAVVKGWIGSSKFNTKEMSLLIDQAIKIAVENGVTIDTSEL